MPYREAVPASTELVLLLEPGCDRIVVAGSIRRLKRCVNDVEIVAIPKHIPNLLGEPGDNELFAIIDEEVRSGRWYAQQGHNPHAKASRYTTPSPVTGRLTMQLDLFLAIPETWGVLLALRTGPADYSKRIVTERYRGGLLDDGYAVRDCRLRYNGISGPGADWREHELIETPEEADFLRFAGGWIEPHLRM